MRLEDHHSEIIRNRGNIENSHIFGNTNDSNDQYRAQTDIFPYARSDK